MSEQEKKEKQADTWRELLNGESENVFEVWDHLGPDFLTSQVPTADEFGKLFQAYRLDETCSSRAINWPKYSDGVYEPLNFSELVIGSNTILGAIPLNTKCVKPQSTKCEKTQINECVRIRVTSVNSRRADSIRTYRQKKQYRRYASSVRYRCRQRFAQLRPRKNGRFIKIGSWTPQKQKSMPTREWVPIK